MEKLANDTLSLWREEGRQSIQENFQVFRNVVAEAKHLAERGKYDAAAVYAQIAALHAQFKHCGFFTSSELEHILLTIGRKTIQRSLSPSKSAPSPGKPKKILHISTNVHSPFGGIPRLLRRWIKQDSERVHSLALTTQFPDEVPKTLRDAIFNSQGKIYQLNQRIDSIIYRAKRLRKIAAEADVVVLHIWEYDVIPTIAFANKENSPPVIYVNHGDHNLWLGVSISDVIANLRQSGMHLSQERRGIEPERNMLLPIVLEPSHRVFSRAEAKQQLGLPENSVLLLSIARATKYRTIDGISFADAHVSLLKQHDQAILLVVGVGEREDWLPAIEQTQGRIKVLGQTEDTAIFYQAADIYVDSFPFVSSTSLLEAGSYGVPLVSRFPYSDACGIMCGDQPGLTGNLILVKNLEEYTSVLMRLVEDEEFRLSIGEATRRKIIETHMGSNWLRSLEELYIRAMTLPRVNFTSNAVDQMFLGEPDVLCPSIYGIELGLDLLFLSFLRLMPLDERLRVWFRMVKEHAFREGKINLWPGQLLPTAWFHYYSSLRSFLPF